MPITVVRATNCDLEQLARLNKIVQSVHVDLSPDIFRDDVNEEELHEFWATRLKETKNIVAVAQIDGIISGSIWFEIQERPRSTLKHSGRQLYVHHIVVDTDCRESGVGVALLKYVEREAETLNIDKVALDAWAANSTAQTFFAAQGYHPMNIVLTKQLNEI